MAVSTPTIVDYGERVDKVANFINNGSKLLINNDKLGLPAGKRRKLQAAIRGVVTQVTLSNRPTLIALVKRMDGVSSKSSSRAAVISGSGGSLGFEPLIMTLGMGIMEIVETALSEETKYIGKIFFQILGGILGALELLSPNFYPQVVLTLKDYADASRMSCEDTPSDGSNNTNEPTSTGSSSSPKSRAITVGSADEL